MVDIHSHLLFRIDDGAKNIEESLEMLKMAYKNGYTDIVCSSHFFVDKFENENYNKNFQLLNERIKKEKIDVRIYKGNEAALQPEILKKLNIINTINNSDYILIELKSGIIYQACVNFIKKLQSMGYKPILAHIERYRQLSLNEIISLYNMGVILQMNIRTAGSMNRQIRELIERKYIEVVATDSHNITRRNYDVEKYLKELRKITGDEYFKILTETNPRKIINNQDIKKGEWHEKKSTGNIFITLWNKLFSGNEPE